MAVPLVPKFMRKPRSFDGGCFLPDIPTSQMITAFGSGKDIRVAHLSVLSHIREEEVKVWCVQNAVYQVPTFELVQYLKEKIRGRRAIEICSGNGVIGRALGIPRTDSHMQKRPDIREHYQRLQQPIVDPPDDVEEFEAMNAVRHYKPEVVVGCFVTHRWQEGDKVGSVFGVEEDKLLDYPSVQTYIMVGNSNVHGSKNILERPHKEERHSFLVSRATVQSNNRIYIWGE